MPGVVSLANHYSDNLKKMMLLMELAECGAPHINSENWGEFHLRCFYGMIIDVLTGQQDGIGPCTIYRD